MKFAPQGLVEGAVESEASGARGERTWKSGPVTDFANYYDVKPLYNQGITGKGRTVGIMTLASFTPSDAFAYWRALGLKVASNRISIVNVDGGPGAPSDRFGSERRLWTWNNQGSNRSRCKDHCLSGPKTNQGFVDLFAAAIDANAADSLSISWGEWEWLDNLENNPVTDPSTGGTVSTLQAVHELLVRAAIQGQSVFAAAGDGGAYDANDTFGCFPSTITQLQRTSERGLSGE